MNDKNSEPVVPEKWKDPYERIARCEEKVERLEAVAEAANEVWNFCASDWTDKPVHPDIMAEVNEQAMRLGKALKEAGY